MASVVATTVVVANHGALVSRRRNSPSLPSINHSLFKRVIHTKKVSTISPVASASASTKSLDAADERKEWSFVIGTELIPHPDKAEKGGEDALFVKSCSGGVLAVADGVSGWADENVDPSVFPKELMANISYCIDADEVNNDPQILLQQAHAKTCSVGSATVIIAMLDKHGTLKIANVGDCGLRILRKGQIIFSTSPQQHYFDCPFQLSSEMAGQTYKDAMVYKADVLEEDIVVMGSDGLFDNVFDHEIENVVRTFGWSQPEVVNKTAQALADLANTHARDSEFESPYSLEARIQGYDVPWWKRLLGMKLTGGKLDDITVVVGMLVNAPDVSRIIVKDDNKLREELQPQSESLFYEPIQNQLYGKNHHKDVEGISSKLLQQ